MLSQSFATQSEYYSGQGVVLIGKRDANGNPAGLLPLGDVSALQIAINTTVVNHKNSQDGQRAIDARLQTETAAQATITIDNWNAENLALGLRGTETEIASGTATNESVNAYAGAISPLAHVNVSGLSLELGETSLTAYTAPGVAYDFIPNLAAGSFQLNDGSETPTAGLGNVATAVTVGATTTITVPGTYAVGDTVVLGTFTGAEGASLSGKTTTVATVVSGGITVPINTSADTITVGANSTVYDIDQPLELSASYTYSEQYEIDALTQPLQDVFLRFEGLNTVDGNNPVVVDIFKFSYDPLKELSLLTDAFAQIQVEGAILYDALQTGASKYFRVRKLN